MNDENAKRRVLRWLWYVGFCCATAVAVVAVLIFFGLLVAYAYDVTQNGDLASVVGSMVDFVLGGATVLAIELLIYRASSKTK